MPRHYFLRTQKISTFIEKHAAAVESETQKEPNAFMNKGVYIWPSNIIDPNESVCIRYDVDGFVDVHKHDFFEIEYILRGTAVQKINGSEYYAQKGDIIFVNIGDVHSYSGSGNCEIVNYLFRASDLAALSHRNSPADFSKIFNEDFPKHVVLNPLDMPKAEELLISISRELSEKKFGYSAVVSNSLMNLLITIIRNRKGPAVHSVFNDILDYIDRNYATVTSSELSAKFHYNKNYFCTTFKKRVGKTPTEYINLIKIQKATRLLADTSMSIENIVDAVGFADKKYFYTVFNKQVGLTPGAYRHHIRDSSTIR